MPWGRLDDQANGNAKLLALSDAAWRMWGCGLIYCQANLTDGFIPDHAIQTFGVRARNKAHVVSELLATSVPGKSSLWHTVTGGYQVHDYLDWNDARAIVLEEREKARQRMERLRSGRRGSGYSSGEQRGEHSPHRSGVHVPQPQGTPLLENEAERRAPAPNRAIFDRYVERYQTITGEKPHIDGARDGRLIKELLGQHDETTVLAALDAFFEYADDFVKGKGYAFPLFKSQFNACLAKSARQSNGRKETSDEYFERVGYCAHKPACEKPGGAACRAKPKAAAS